MKIPDQIQQTIENTGFEITSQQERSNLILLTLESNKHAINGEPGYQDQRNAQTITSQINGMGGDAEWVTFNDKIRINAKVLPINEAT